MEDVKSSIEEAHTLASPGLRYLGQLLDFFVSIGLFMFILWAGKSLGIEQEVASLISLSIAVSYFLFSDGLPNGQSIGKKALGISVISSKTGKSCTIIQSFFRNMLTPIIGSIDAVFILGKKRQRLGDKLARTIVVVNS